MDRATIVAFSEQLQPFLDFNQPVHIWLSRLKEQVGPATALVVLSVYANLREHGLIEGVESQSPKTTVAQYAHILTEVPQAKS